MPIACVWNFVLPMHQLCECLLLEIHCFAYGDMKAPYVTDIAAEVVADGSLDRVYREGAPCLRIADAGELPRKKQ